MSQFDRDRILTYRDYDLYHHSIATRFGRDSTTVRRIGNRWIHDSHTERRALQNLSGFSITNIRRDRHVICVALRDRIATSRTMSHEMRSFARQHEQFDDICNSMDCQHDDHNLKYIWSYITDRKDSCAVINDESGNRNDIASSFQTNKGSECSIMMAASVFGTNVDNAHYQFAFDILLLTHHVEYGVLFDKRLDHPFFI